MAYQSAKEYIQENSSSLKITGALNRPWIRNINEQKLTIPDETYQLYLDSIEQGHGTFSAEQRDLFKKAFRHRFYLGDNLAES